MNHMTIGTMNRRIRATLHPGEGATCQVRLALTHLFTRRRSQGRRGMTLRYAVTTAAAAMAIAATRAT